MIFVALYTFFVFTVSVKSPKSSHIQLVSMDRFFFRKWSFALTGLTESFCAYMAVFEFLKKICCIHNAENIFSCSQHS